MSSGNSIVQNMAVKAVFDLILCHGATSLDRVVGIDPDLGLPEPCPLGSQVPAENCAYGVEGDLVLAMRRPLLELLVSLLDCGTIYEELGDDFVEEPETPRSLIAEGFAKLLLQSKLFQEIQSIEDVILSKLLRLYFNDDLEISPRLQQCLSVFFNNYSVLSAANKVRFSFTLILSVVDFVSLFFLFVKVSSVASFFDLTCDPFPEMCFQGLYSSDAV
jgi:hypothetical protein